MKPLLAYSKVVTAETAPLPMFASIKFDGIRCCMVEGEARSRSEKLIPNLYVQKCLQGLHGQDGELVLRDRTKDFNDQQSAFMSVHGEPDFEYLVFDYWDSDLPFCQRMIKTNLSNPYIQIVQQTYVTTAEEVEHLYQTALANGEEGLILRSIYGKYKHGRSTLNQALSLKLKPWFHTEGVVTGFEPLIDEAGVVHDTLGKLNIDMNGALFNVGTGLGLTHELRRLIWNNKPKYLGLSTSIAHLGLSKYGIPRSPSWRGFRYD
jgi:ATP-dependent DNA ligase